MPLTSDIIQLLGQDDQLFFIHIPKTAGTTFNNLLATRYVQSDICPIAGSYSRLLEIKDELPRYKLIRGHFPYRLVDELPTMPVCVTFLRDPVARTLSFFDQAQRDERERRKTCDRSGATVYERVATISFEEFLNDETLVRSFGNTHTIYFCSETADVWTEGGQKAEMDTLIKSVDIELAKQNLASIPFVGITEEFERSIELFTYTFGLAPIPRFSSKNISPRRQKRAQLIEQYRDILEEGNAADMELYAFSRQLFEERYAKMLDEKREGAVPVTVERQNTIYANLRQVDPGAGWYAGVYKERHGYVRWTGPEAVASLSLPALVASRAYTVKFRVVHTVSPDLLKSLQLEVNGVAIPLTKTVDPAHSWLCTGMLPAIALEGTYRTRLRFSLDTTIAPASIFPDATDTRELGIQLQWVHIYPH